MSYAQTNYEEPQGIPPTKYSIHQIGCFITSFCNLEARFGKTIDPPGMNAFLRDNGFYIDVDDGVRDDVAWSTVNLFDHNTVVEAVGGASRPPHNNSIVKFIYNNGNSTHFCLVEDVEAGTIIDSWDGKVKSWDVYGGVKAWASYTNVEGGNMPTIVDDNITALLYSAIMHRVPNASTQKEQYDAWRGKDILSVITDMYKSGEWQALDNQLKDNAVRAAKFDALAKLLGLDINKDGMDGVITKVQALLGSTPAGGSLPAGTYLKFTQSDVITVK